MNRTILFLLFAILIAFSGCTPTEQSQKQHAGDKEKKEAFAIATFASQHHAATNWITSLPIRGIDGAYTFDIAHALVTTNGTPILLTMDLLDVEPNGSNSIATFSHEYVETNAIFTLRLSLACDASQTQWLIHSKAPYKPTFAIISKIVSVSRPSFQITTSGDDKYEVDFDSAPSLFIAKGTCLDLLPIGETTLPPSCTNHNDSPAFAQILDKQQQAARSTTERKEEKIPSVKLRQAHFECDAATLQQATALKIAGWTYIMPEPKSSQAAWGNHDRRTTWWNGYWVSTNRQKTSSAMPKKDENGNFFGDGQGALYWRRGGSPAYPTKIEWLCSDSGGIEPQ